MLRETNLQPMPWSDKTMSVLRTHQLESCEKRLGEFPEQGIFTVGGEAIAADLWKLSFDGQEHPALVRMHTMQEMQAHVMLQAPAEFTLLSQPETELVENMLQHGGFMPLNDWNDMDAAESLVRRLWCIVLRHDEHMALVLQPPLFAALSMVMNDSEYTDLRDQLADFTTRVMALTQVFGVIPADSAIAALAAIVRGTLCDDETLMMRFLRTSFDYTYDRSGRMLLVHPGLAHPEAVTVREDAWSLNLAKDFMEAAADYLLPEEKPLYDRLCGAIRGAVRPESSEEDAARDLIVLAKQGVDEAELRAVLTTMLIMHPGTAMLHALHEVWLSTPRWTTMRSGVLQ